MPGNWVLGALVQNIWSFAGPSDEPDVNKFTFQYFLNYNLGDGWYLTSTSIITADWEKSSSNQWTVPFGGGIGRLMLLASCRSISSYKCSGMWKNQKGDRIGA